MIQTNYSVFTCIKGVHIWNRSAMDKKKIVHAIAICCCFQCDFFYKLFREHMLNYKYTLIYKWNEIDFFFAFVMMSYCLFLSSSLPFSLHSLHYLKCCQSFTCDTNILGVFLSARLFLFPNPMLILHSFSKEN